MEHSGIYLWRNGDREVWKHQGWRDVQGAKGWERAGRRGGCEAFSENVKNARFWRNIEIFLRNWQLGPMDGIVRAKGKMRGFLTHCCNTLLLQATVCWEDKWGLIKIRWWEKGIRPMNWKESERWWKKQSDISQKGWWFLHLNALNVGVSQCSSKMRPVYLIVLSEQPVNKVVSLMFSVLQPNLRWFLPHFHELKKIIQIRD